MYGEVILALNTIFNYIILSFTNNIGTLQVSRKRLLISALIGACIVVFIGQSILPMVLAFVVMTISAFGFRFMKWFRSAVVCIVAALFAGGLLTALEPLFSYMPTVYFASTSSVIAVAGLVLLQNRWTVSKQQSLERGLVLETTMTFQGNSWQLSGFIDTGNSCIEPLTGRAVHFIAWHAMEARIDDALKNALLSWQASNPYKLTMFPKELQSKLTVIRFATVQEKTVYGIAFRYDQWEVHGADGFFIAPGFFVLTMEANHFPQQVDVILHVSTLCQ
ncbi:sigma-E processing peptidase SpoIIGA [Viridibacillus sp. YIM B01967]|uniref:Sigma-E processing peptidase SpoIIGA n=1 Tax=Viridibacillus soli TaxID=2798301 RepID=A0ABS1H4X8_9BACL|nr:sigma-E processing peptidase SpoIIGA [Viridibacillus soli]MBK3494473.1 sigma-E processing peptidase SpoIIGA [Viridibacillus soli]